jgi:hypothetical protein
MEIGNYSVIVENFGSKSKYWKTVLHRVLHQSIRLSPRYQMMAQLQMKVKALFCSSNTYLFMIDDDSNQKSIGERSHTKKKRSGNRLMRSNKNKPKIADEQSSFEDTPDHVFEQMLLTAFQNEEKLVHFLNGKNKMEFIRCYADLLDRLSLLNLQQAQWDYYLHIGETQHIWTDRMSKHLAEKNSLVHVFGRSKRMIAQRRTQIQEKLQHTTNTREHFERQMLLPSVPNIDYSPELNLLCSIVQTFVQEHQEQLRREVEYKKRMLILDATDHRLVQAFFALKPKKGQVSAHWIYSRMITVIYFFSL